MHELMALGHMATEFNFPSLEKHFFSGMGHIDPCDGYSTIVKYSHRTSYWNFRFFPQADMVNISVAAQWKSMEIIMKTLLSCFGWFDGSI